jgi:quercetin dioxygenase-like cupin family protein
MKPPALLACDQPGVFRLHDSPPAVGEGILSRTLLATPELRGTLFTFAAGEALTEHTSTARALVQVCSGECEFTVAGERRTLRPGDLLHLPPNAPHAVHALTDMTMLLIIAPVRESA